MSDESMPSSNYRLVYDGQIESPTPVVGTLDFYATNNKKARGIARETIMGWNEEYTNFGLIKLLALDDKGKPVDNECLFRKRK